MTKNKPEASEKGKALVIGTTTLSKKSVENKSSAPSSQNLQQKKAEPAKTAKKSD